MTDAHKKRAKIPTMPITVTPIPSSGRIEFPPLEKPTDSGSWANHYDIHYEKDDEGKDLMITVKVKWKDGHRELPAPIYFKLSCSSDRFTGVGFAESIDGIKKRKKPGYCGGCFVLCTDLRKKPRSMRILNWGPCGKKGEIYHFTLWLKQAGKLHHPDPQIYNDGTMRQLPPKKKKAGR
jgi:hypothetical protein